ncbi:MAG: cobyrinate a,c-diamide synthase [Firmicutes bacterium]|nr:cobyrinate a,c-diamide synthase [Bacillota bacterium]
MDIPRIVIAGTHSGVGKTTISVGLMGAFRQKGFTVQGFKAGPDFIDPGYHTVVTGRISRNLDTWMVDPNVNLELFQKGATGADISVIEGVMGLYDGVSASDERGSTAHLSKVLASPVVLVVNAESLARSAAAIVLGYMHFDPDVRIAGVILNRVAGPRHYEMVRDAIESKCRIPVVGWLKRDQELEMPERHLGLVPAGERGDLSDLFKKLAARIAEGIDLQELIRIAKSAPKLQPVEFPPTLSPIPIGARANPVRIAIARDEAFSFYYQDNLDMLCSRGAELVEFSPLRDPGLPCDVAGIYIGGGFPEVFAASLAANEHMKECIRAADRQGIPIYAECGGLMYLSQAIIDLEGRSYPMVGLLPVKVKMQKRLAALGYVEVIAREDNILMNAGERARGHEFHYSDLIKVDVDPRIHRAYIFQGKKEGREEGFARDNLLTAYTHLHFASNPRLVDNFLKRCNQKA